MTRALLTVLLLALLAPAAGSARTAAPVRVGDVTIQRFVVETGRLVAYGDKDGAQVRVPVVRLEVSCSLARLQLDGVAPPLMLRGTFCSARRSSVVAQLNALLRR
jgi:hypothetical protein